MGMQFASILTIGGFAAAMVGAALNVLGMTLMWFAPVQSVAFRSRFKLNLSGAVILVGGIAAMALGAYLTLGSVRPIP